MSRETIDQYTERYATRMAQVPDLSAEEEREDIRAWRERGDIAARDRVLGATVKVAIAVARQHKKFGLPMSDLIALGTDGIFEALDRYDLNRHNVRFASYAWWWILAKITRAECKSWHMVSGEPTSSHRLFSLLKALPKAQAACGSNPDEVYEHVAEEIGKPVETAKRWLTLVCNRMISLDAVLNEDNSCMKDRLVDENELSVEEQNEIAEIRTMVYSKVQRILPSLTPVQITVLEKRLLCTEPESLASVGNEVNLSGERVRQIESVLKEKLRKLLKDEAEEMGIDTRALVEQMFEASYAAA